MTKQDWIEIKKTIIPILKWGGIGVLPTDTLYGVVGSAFDKKTVELIYELRKRDSDKPMIILISSVGDLKKFGVVLSGAQKKTLSKIWPAKVSVVFSCKDKKFKYLHRGKNSLAFRLPAEAGLVGLLKKTGPLVAPSANKSGKNPAATYLEAKKYFGEEVDFYVDGGKLKSKPSTIIEMKEDGSLKVLREGAVKLPKRLK